MGVLRLLGSVAGGLLDDLEGGGVRVGVSLA